MENKVCTVINKSLIIKLNSVIYGYLKTKTKLIYKIFYY